jgi:hypothetical protein
MNIYDKNHPHHAVWKEYSESLLAGEPVAVEFRINPQHSWSVSDTPSAGMVRLEWCAHFEYRIAKKMRKLIVNGKNFEYPEPFRGTLNESQQYFTPEIVGVVPESRVRYNCNRECGERHVANGIVHLDSESATAHAEVLIQISKL